MPRNDDELLNPCVVEGDDPDVLPEGDLDAGEEPDSTGILLGLAPIPKMLLTTFEISAVCWTAVACWVVVDICAVVLAVLEQTIPAVGIHDANTEEELNAPHNETLISNNREIKWNISNSLLHEIPNATEDNFVIDCPNLCCLRISP